MDFDLIDKRIVAELDINSRQSNSKIAKKLRISRERVDYRIKKLIASKVINKFPTIINPTKFGYSMFKLYLQFQDTNKKIESEMIDWLVREPKVQWITTCKGKWDMNIIVFARDVECFNKTMQHFYNEYGAYIYARNFNMTLSVGNMEKNWILKQKKESKIVYTANERALVELDDCDFEILNLIANNARLNVVDIARKLKTTSRIVQYKIKQMERKQVIKGYTVSLNYGELNKMFYKVVFYIPVITDKLKAKLITYCQTKFNMPYFVFCVGEWPFEVEYVVEHIEELYDALDDIKEYFVEIKRYEIILLSKEYKFNFMPIDG